MRGVPSPSLGSRDVLPFFLGSEAMGEILTHVLDESCYGVWRRSFWRGELTVLCPTSYELREYFDPSQ